MAFEFGAGKNVANRVDMFPGIEDIIKIICSKTMLQRFKFFNIRVMFMDVFIPLVEDGGIFFFSTK